MLLCGNLTLLQFYHLCFKFVLIVCLSLDLCISSFGNGIFPSGFANCITFELPIVYHIVFLAALRKGVSMIVSLISRFVSLFVCLKKTEERYS